MGSLVHVIGHVVACEHLDNYDKNGRSGKKKPLTFADADGNELRCTLWGAYAQQFQDFVDTCPNRGKIMLILQLGMMKIWDGKMGVQNGYHGTRLFLFNGHENIPKEEFVDVELYRLRSAHGLFCIPFFDCNSSVLMLNSYLFGLFQAVWD
ncbi:PIF1-like helicase [Artemisia annua]|uniref:PIF1-like helicase n=1 Tax=Artemisia annua TaxID=35608 RepID=A0A2U1MXC6_ARTAN|nr:PIF1-like helicase [Artemisia annua]